MQVSTSRLAAIFKPTGYPDRYDWIIVGRVWEEAETHTKLQQIVLASFTLRDGRPSKYWHPYFEGMVNRIYPPELQLNKANTSDTEAPFLDLHLSISNGFPRSTSYGVYMSQPIRFARVSSHVADFNARNKSLTAKLLQQGYQYHKLRKTFSKFYRRHYKLISKFNVGLKNTFAQTQRPIGTWILWWLST